LRIVSDTLVVKDLTLPVADIDDRNDDDDDDDDGCC